MAYIVMPYINYGNEPYQGHVRCLIVMAYIVIAYIAMASMIMVMKHTKDVLRAIVMVHTTVSAHPSLPLQIHNRTADAVVAVSRSLAFPFC